MAYKVAFSLKGAKAYPIQCSKRKGRSEDRGRYRFRGDPDDPSYKKIYGSNYTKRQVQILSGEIPWEVVPLKQISLLVNKAQALGDIEAYEKARVLQHLKRNQDVYVPQMTIDEAKDIL